MILRPFSIGVQGVLSIKERDGETGGFQAVLNLLQNFEKWVKIQPEDCDLICPDMTRRSRESFICRPMMIGYLILFLPMGCVLIVQKIGC